MPISNVSTADIARLNSSDYAITPKGANYSDAQKALWARAEILFKLDSVENSQFVLGSLHSSSEGGYSRRDVVQQFNSLIANAKKEFKSNFTVTPNGRQASIHDENNKLLVTLEHKSGDFHFSTYNPDGSRANTTINVAKSSRQ